MVVLTPIQMKAKDVIEWLMSDDWKQRAVGRSYLMAVILIEKALNNPGIWINVWDHGPYHPKKEEFMLRMIEQIIKEHYPEFNFKINCVNKAFCMEKR